MKFFNLVLLLVFSISIVKAQDKWDVSSPPEIDYKKTKIQVKEGTWLNVDEHNGKIVFDLLGDIYMMPLSGGKATAIRTGIAWEVQPRFSPDGKTILFTSDAGGGDNIWIMNTDGSDAEQLTKEDFRLLNNASWTPDGNYFVARKHYTSGRSLGAGEMWMYHKTGGAGTQLTKRKNDQQDVNEPCVSPNGRYLYYSEDDYPGGYFQYNKDPNDQIYAIKRYDRETGKTIRVTGGPGGAMRPQISPDGKQLAFVHRIRTKTVLMRHNLETGEEFVVFDGLSKDQSEAWAIFGTYPGFDWLSDNRHVVIWGEGQINKVNMFDKKSSVIPFEVNAELEIAETLKFDNPVFEKEIGIKVIRQAVTSPDEKTLIFNAIGHLWSKKLPNGKPQRLTDSKDFEFEPAFSKDGKSIAYVTWNDEEKGAVKIMDLNTKVSRKITPQKGIYRTPNFSPDGKSVVYRKDGGNSHQGYTFTKEPGIYVLPIALGKAEPELVSPKGEFPVFSKDGKRVFYQTGGFLFGSLTKAYHSVKVNGSDDRKIADAKYAQRFSVSPDNQWIAWSELYKVFIAPMPQVGQPIGLSANTKAVPVAQVAKDAGINLHWSSDSKKLHWTLGEEYFTNELTERFTFLENAVDSIPPMDSVGIKIGLEVASDRPAGMVAFTNARIITMEGDNVIENGTIIIEGNEIMEVGASADIRVPGKAKVIDAQGKTIMPGIIDVHGHLGNFRYGLSPQQQWEYFANLAYGVTTAHDPSSNSEMVFSHSEMIKTGDMIGPRLYSTGNILYGADGDFKAVINNLDDARSALRRTKAYGAFSVKSYNQPRRDQRQQVIQAAKELEMLVVPEGGSTMYHNLTQVVDGHTGVEHNIPVAPLYDDILQMWAATKAHNTPTLIVNYGGVNGEYYFYEKDKVWEKSRLLNFMPREMLDSRSRHRTAIPQEEYDNGHILVAQSCKALQDAGVNINLGAHGQLQGLGAHWELWMLQQGGMTNLEAIRAATMNGAVYLGMDKEIGSLEKGKLADLIVIDGNPLTEIRDTEKVIYTMVNGRLYDAEKMNEVGNYDSKRVPFFFEGEGSGNGYPYFQATGSHVRGQCGCGL